MDSDHTLFPEHTSFYKNLVGLRTDWSIHYENILEYILIGISQAASAVQAGVCVDLFAITNEYTDLNSLKALTVESGGSLYLYSNTDESTLPQDM